MARIILLNLAAVHYSSCSASSRLRSSRNGIVQCRHLSPFNHDVFICPVAEFKLSERLALENQLRRMSPMGHFHVPPTPPDSSMVTLPLRFNEADTIQTSHLKLGE